jgi:hypothetical protein
MGIGITILFFFLHFFNPPWQAGCFRPFPSDTGRVGCGLASALLVTEISQEFICSVEKRLAVPGEKV